MSSASQPLFVDVTRGTMVESRHQVSYAVSDNAGKILFSGGDLDALVYGRSALKPIQALPLVESGAADAFELSPAEIAMACASHNGESRHVAVVEAWLGRLGLSEDDLELGAHLPYDADATVALLHSGGEARRVHNNCSGKHSGFLTLARHLGVPTKGYVRLDHPVQQRVLGVLEMMTGLDLSNTPRGIDGCGIPVIAIPLGNMALAMARLADPDDQPEARQEAARRIRQAMAAEPVLVSGTKGYCSRVMALTGERAVIKIGAEGVYCGSLPELGLGIALKTADGNGRAAENAMGRILARLGLFDHLGEDQRRALTAPTLHNRAGQAIGEIRASDSCPF